MCVWCDIIRVPSCQMTPASQCVGRKDFTEGATVYLDEDGTWLPGVVIKTCQNGWRTIRVDGCEKPIRIRGTEQLRPKEPTFTDGVRRTVFALRPLKVSVCMHAPPFSWSSAFGCTPTSLPPESHACLSTSGPEVVLCQRDLVAAPASF